MVIFITSTNPSRNVIYMLYNVICIKMTDKLCELDRLNILFKKMKFHNNNFFWTHCTGLGEIQF